MFMNMFVCFNIITQRIGKAALFTLPKRLALHNKNMAGSSKTIVLTGFGGYEKLVIEQRDKRKPSNGQVCEKFITTPPYTCKSHNDLCRYPLCTPVRWL